MLSRRLAVAVGSLDDVLAFLRCPHCAGALQRADAVVRCPRGHAFDVARQGYLNLMRAGAPGGADDADMVSARVAFLAGGHYDALADAVADAADAAPDHGCVVDLGAGTGYYLARVLARRDAQAGVALDVSKPALRRAARAHPRIGAVGCDVWGAVPVASGVAAAVLCVFAPRNGPEMRRVLRPDGVCIVVTPTADHLVELVEPLGLLTVDEHKDARLADQLRAHLARVARRPLEMTLALGHRAVADLVAMGPTARHVAPSQRAERIALLPDPVPVTASFALSVYHPRVG